MNNINGTSTSTNELPKSMYPAVLQDDLPSSKWTIRATLFCAILSAITSIIAGIGWVTGQHLVANITSGYVPMAPSTILCFLLMNGTLLVSSRQSVDRRLRLFTMGTALIVALSCALVFLRTVGVISLNLEYILHLHPKDIELGTGRMSPITSVALMLAAVILLVQLSVSNGRVRTITAVLSTVLAASGFAIVMAYAYGDPFFYGGPLIPVAFMTGMAMLFLSIGLMAAAGPACWPLRLVAGDSLGARFRRVIFPIILIVIFSGDMIDAQVDTSRSNVFSKAFVDSFLAILLFFISSVLVSKATSTITISIERADAERKRAEEVLQENKQRDREEKVLRDLNNYNRSLLEASLDPLVTIDHTGHISDVNMATEQVTGRLRQDLIGTNFSNYFTEPHEADKGYQQVFKDGSVLDYPLEIRHTDGHITPVLYNASVYCNENGEVLGVFAAARDITERKQKEKALRDLNKYNRSLIEASLDPLVTIDHTGHISDVNMATEQVTGYCRGDLIGTNFSHYFTEPLKAEDGYQQVFEDGTVLDYPLEIRHRDGHITPVLYNASLYHDESGQVLGVFAAARDITERKRTELLARVAERDHHIAEVLQHIVMPSRIPELPASYDTALIYQPASHEADVCGDFCDIFDLGDGRIGISIGDIVGKGLLAAIRVSAAKNMIRSYAFLYDQPAKVMSLVNDALCRDIAMENDMLTAFFAILDTQNGALTYSNAGHEPPILWNADGNTNFLTSGGPMFCGMGKQVYNEDSYTLKAGDIFVAVTDGITEASADKRLEQFGAEGIIRCLCAAASDLSERISTTIIKNATEFANGALHDDATVIVIKRI